MKISNLVLEKIKERQELDYKKLCEESNEDGWYWLKGALVGVDLDEGVI